MMLFVNRHLIYRHCSASDEDRFSSPVSETFTLEICEWCHRLWSCCRRSPGHFFGGGFLKRYDNCSVPGTDVEIECHWSQQHRVQQPDGNTTDNADTADVLACASS